MKTENKMRERKEQNTQARFYFGTKRERRDGGVLLASTKQTRSRRTG